MVLEKKNVEMVSRGAASKLWRAFFLLMICARMANNYLIQASNSFWVWVFFFPLVARFCVIPTDFYTTGFESDLIITSFFFFLYFFFHVIIIQGL